MPLHWQMTWGSKFWHNFSYEGALDVEKVALINWRSKIWVWKEIVHVWSCHYVFCSTKMAAILHGNGVFGVYFQCNAMDQARKFKWGKQICYMSIISVNVIYRTHVQVEQNIILTLLWFVLCLGEPKGSVMDWLAWNFSRIFSLRRVLFSKYHVSLELTFKYLFLTTGGGLN